MNNTLLFICGIDNVDILMEMLLKNNLSNCDELLKNFSVLIKTSIKNRNLKTLEILINFYSKNVLDKYEYNTTDYNINFYKLKKMIRDSIVPLTLPPNIYEFLVDKKFLQKKLEFIGPSIFKEIQNDEEDSQESLLDNYDVDTIFCETNYEKKYYGYYLNKNNLEILEKQLKNKI